MRRILIMIFILLISGVCWSLSPLLNHSSPTSTITYPTHTSTAIPPSPASTKTPTITKTPASPGLTTPTLTPVTSPNPASESFTVYYHPDDRLYVGDLVSFEVISPPGIDVRDASLHVQVDPPSGSTFNPGNFVPWGIQGRDQATLLWVWDTHDEDPGTHTLVFSTQPYEVTWTKQVTLLPSTDMPPVQVDASWAATQTECCTVFYITNTASERDLSALTNLMDEQARDSIEEMDSDFTQPITVTILPRLLGHGGFASSDISVSYLDRNYAANSFALVVQGLDSAAL